jgi:hypothetical protein
MQANRAFSPTSASSRCIRTQGARRRRCAVKRYERSCCAKKCPILPATLISILSRTPRTQKVPDPPGNVNFNIVQDTKNPSYKTVRQRLGAHATEAMCTGCHKLVDPIGLALENFDTVGTFRAAENGVAIDASGELDGLKFADAAGLGKAVHDNPAAASCLVNRMYAYGVGRVPTKGEANWLRTAIEPRFAADGYKVMSLLRQIALSDAFYTVVSPQGDAKVAALTLPASPQLGDQK